MTHPLVELALVFLKLGAISFGGPAAHVALIEAEVVQRRRWLTREQYLDLLGATNLIPGPNSTEMALHVGRLRGGLAGLIVAGIAMIAPAFASVLLLATLYVNFGARPELGAILNGIKPVMLAIVTQALVRLARPALGKSRLCLILALISGGLAWAFEGRDLAIVLSAGLAAVVARSGTHWLKSMPPSALLATTPVVAAAAIPAVGPTLSSLFLVFLKIGATLFGSGYVLLPYLRANLVIQRGWINESQLLDAITVGQTTPGPLFTSATFVGYLLAGFPGAIVATVGIFLPAFVLVALSGPLIPRLRQSKAAANFLDGVNAASLALMAVVAIGLLRTECDDPVRLFLFLLCLAALIWTKVNSVWLILAGATFGLLRTLLQTHT